MKSLSFALLACLILGGCGQSGGNEADALERAAEQSTPEAADVLRNAAARGDNVQEAMQEAGNAQAAAPRPKAAPPARAAKPHVPAEPVPPPQIPDDGNEVHDSH